MSQLTNRRGFFKTAAVGALGAAASFPPLNPPSPPPPRARTPTS